MSTRSTQKARDPKNTGQGAEGMGGQPDDNPRDIAGGGSGRTTDDRGGGTGPIPGAFGGGPGGVTEGGPAGDETVGVHGDKAATENLNAQAERPRDGGHPAGS
ncbi:MAG TPA: hypothetical protein VG406_05975 [Isosphaeraceae bacterium]|jgi:hypothetical protein|nr:hypothetical protein [Isosphaeraceae bacterium]